MKKGDGGARQVAGMGSAPAPSFARTSGMPSDRQLKKPGPGAPDSGQTKRPTTTGTLPSQRQGGRHGSTGGGAKE